MAIADNAFCRIANAYTLHPGVANPRGHLVATYLCLTSVKWSSRCRGWLKSRNFSNLRLFYSDTYSRALPNIQFSWSEIYFLVNRNRVSGSATRNNKLTVPGSVKYFGIFAFSYCLSLRSATFLDGVTRIADYAFENCKNLTEVTIGNSVTYIGEYAFASCSSLTSITIPVSWQRSM